jgi:hypothetical protein
MWGSLVAFQVWDLTTPVQIRASPFLKCLQNQKKQNQQEDLVQDMEKELEIE